MLLPGPDELAETLVELAVPHEDVDELVALLGPLRRDARLWGLLERGVRALAGTMGGINGPDPLPGLPAGAGDLYRWFYVYLFVAALPHVRAYHRARGIPADVSRLTLADLPPRRHRCGSVRDAPPDAPGAAGRPRRHRVHMGVLRGSASACG